MEATDAARAPGKRASVDGRVVPRRPLKRALVVGSAAGLESSSPAQFLSAASAQGSAGGAHREPAAVLPSRDWERIYRDQFAEDDSFVFTCAPNDTHNCLLRAHVKNGVVVRISPTYGYGKAKDLDGNQASHRWDPRVCQKGLILGRRIYGDRRVKAPMIRRGFKEWADAGFPRRPDGTPRMDTTRRGYDEWLQVSWDEAPRWRRARSGTSPRRTTARRAARSSSRATSRRWSRRCTARACRRSRCGMPLLGIGRVFGFYRFANMLALLDRRLRPDVPSTDVVGSRAFDNYAWHTDLPPGHPMVTGSQTVDFDLFAAEHTKLLVVIGMNWICTKMPDGHWLADARLKGTRVVVISADYMPTANKADEIVILRPGRTRRSSSASRAS